MLDSFGKFPQFVTFYEKVNDNQWKTTVMSGVGFEKKLLDLSDVWVMNLVAVARVVTGKASSSRPLFD